MATRLRIDSVAHDLKATSPGPQRSPWGGDHRGPAENKKLVVLFPFARLPWEPSSLPWGPYRDEGGSS